MPTVVKLMCHVEVPCPECGKPHNVMGTVNVIQSGEDLRIREVDYYVNRPCGACSEADRLRNNKLVNAENRLNRERRKWADKSISDILTEPQPPMPPKPRRRRIPA